MLKIKIVLLILSILSLDSAAAQDEGKNDCPNYGIDERTGERFCRRVIQPGEVTFHWDVDQNRSTPKIKRSFDFTLNQGKKIQLAIFSRYNRHGKVIQQSWTKDTLDDWTYSARDDDGDGVIDRFCQYDASGKCVPVDCQVKNLKETHDRIKATLESVNDPLLKSYTRERLHLADVMYEYCRGR